MKVTYDSEADAMYIYLESIKPGMVKKTVKLNDDLLLDVGANNKILGIEILSVSKNVTKKELMGIVATA